MKSVFAKRNWEGLLELKGKYYPELVKEFYANVENKEKPKPTEIVSCVRGTKVVIFEASTEST